MRVSSPGRIIDPGVQTGIFRGERIGRRRRRRWCCGGFAAAGLLRLIGRAALS